LLSGLTVVGLPVVLSGVKYCDSQQGDSVSSMVKRSEMVCVGDNLITQTTHKTTHSTSSHMWWDRPGSLLIFCTICNKNWGGAWECHWAHTNMYFIERFSPHWLVH